MRKNVFTEPFFEILSEYDPKKIKGVIFLDPWGFSDFRKKSIPKILNTSYIKLKALQAKIFQEKNRLFIKKTTFIIKSTFSEKKIF